MHNSVERDPYSSDFASQHLLNQGERQTPRPPHRLRLLCSDFASKHLSNQGERQTPRPPHRLRLLLTKKGKSRGSRCR
ncbi:hypothetical protein NDU88_002995 [Pleurodeles waltl]|uniref:Uncharacterized protein n=1 Tax=Pleurodeles waltl TaxID=8319 RepID=A0AAV7MYY3_PLEWA|nr:hypothetical protein NDU88_002995 [Pleurodeles waltl]